ncbi:MAG: hypothetical protein F4Z82_15970 [Caldilineaceae bacterium SB0668_bin_21]|nr:hypothetical protein [Caldilineaceae bacterium SB0668_bin_21]MYI35170.1 hypothetical protein [Acidimicrobiaceae bacterium]
MKTRLAAIWNHRNFPKIRRFGNTANALLWGFLLANSLWIGLYTTGVVGTVMTKEEGAVAVAEAIALGEIGGPEGMTEFGATFRTVMITQALWRRLEEGGDEAAQAYVADLVLRRMVAGDYTRHPEALPKIITGMHYCCGGKAGALGVIFPVAKEVARTLPYDPWRNERALTLLRDLNATDEQIAELEALFEAAEAEHYGEDQADQSLSL